MEQALVTYSLIRALYDEGRDYIDSFWPFAVRVLSPDKSPVAPGTVADLVKERFSLAIPVHTTQTLLERAKRRGNLVTRVDKAYALTDAGLEYVRKMESPREVERRVAALVEAASQFLATNLTAFADREYTQKIVEEVVSRGASLFDFVVERPQEVRDGLPAEEKAILEFFRHIEAKDPKNFETLRDLILGSTLAGLLHRPDISDATRNFGETVLYLDTNFLLSILNLRFPVECRPAGELLRLLNRNPRFTLRVLDFTLEEVFGLLRGFAHEQRKYPVGVPIQSLYASMRSSGWTPSRVTEFIAAVDGELGELGIDVLNTGIRIEDASPLDADTLSRHRTYKPEQEERGRLHDLQAIAWVAQERRDTAPRRVEDAGVFFLTEDARLSNYAFIERGHRDRETVSEVMPDRLLTNLLWLKEPQTLRQIPVEAVIAMHSRDLFIDKAVWLKFFDVLQALQDDGHLNEDAASVLLYDAQVHKDLACLGAGRSAEVDEDWVLKRLEDARQEAEWKHEWALQQQEAQLREEADAKAMAAADAHATEVSALQERLSALEARANDREAGEARLLAHIKVQSGRTATWLVRGLKAGLLAALGWWAYHLIPVALAKWSVAEPRVTMLQWLGIIMLAFGWRLDPHRAWASLRLIVQDRLMRRALRQFDLLREGGVQPHEGAG